MKEPSFVFIGHTVHKILLLLDSPNKQLQAEDMDLLTGVKLVHSATECVCQLRCDTVLTELWNAAMSNNATPPPINRRRTMNRNLEDYVVASTVGQSNTND